MFWQPYFLFHFVVGGQLDFLPLRALLSLPVLPSSSALFLLFPFLLLAQRDGSELRWRQGIKIGEFLKLFRMIMEAGENECKTCPSPCDSGGKKARLIWKPGGRALCLLFCPNQSYRR